MDLMYPYGVYPAPMDMKTKASNARQPTPLSEAIAATIRAERSAANLTKDDVLKRAGISRQTYYKLESGERVLDVSQFEAICRAIGISMETVLRRASERVGDAPREQGDAQEAR